MTSDSHEGRGVEFRSGTIPEKKRSRTSGAGGAEDSRVATAKIEE